MNQKPTILIAEDKAALRQLLKERLESRNFLVELAEDGEKALEVFNKKWPEVMVLDVITPEMNGLEVAREVRKKDKEIPMLFLTEGSKAKELPAGLRSEGDDYISKPFSTEELILRIESLLLQKVRIKKEHPEKSTAHFLPVRTGNKTILLNTSKIKYVIASGYYAEIFTKKGKYVVRESLSNLMEVLDPDIYFRCHRSAIINLTYIREIVHSGYSEIDVKMKDNKLISVSKSLKKDFFSVVGIKSST